MHVESIAIPTPVRVSKHGWHGGIGMILSGGSNDSDSGPNHSRRAWRRPLRPVRYPSSRGPTASIVAQVAGSPSSGQSCYATRI